MHARWDALCLSASRRMPRHRSSEQPARMRSANHAFTRPSWVLLCVSTVSSARSSASASVSLNMVFDGILPIVRVVHVEGGARHDPAHARFRRSPSPSRRGSSCSDRESRWCRRLISSSWQALRRPIGILRRHLRLVAVEPLEELLGDVAFVGEAAAEMLGVVHVRVDEAGQHEEAGGVDRLHTAQASCAGFGKVDRPCQRS